jgi:glucose/arabinose dehydrogenase
MIRIGCPVLALIFAVSVTAQTVSLQQVADNLADPVAITHAGDTRLFIVLQGGQIVIWNGGPAVLPTPFLDVRQLVSTGGERGLLGLAFAPDYAQSGHFYINYTDRAGDTVVARYSRSSSDPNRADPASARTILTVDQPFSNHNGGALAFGPDGYLYIGLGDGGSANDPGNRAQNLTDLLGKMLRIDVSQGNPYAIPPDNPYVVSGGARPEIWASGLRNPWRYSFDRVTGDLWIADVGQGSREEINLQPASSDGGENYGWRIMEGSNCHIPPSSNCNPAGTLVEPVIEYGHTNGACSVTGGYVYRGTRYPRLGGMYIYADYCNGVIWGATRLASGIFNIRTLFDASFPISTFGEDVNGELYVADHGNGRIFRIVDSSQLPPKRRSIRH